MNLAHGSSLTVQHKTVNRKQSTVACGVRIYINDLFQRLGLGQLARADRNGPTSDGLWWETWKGDDVMLTCSKTPGADRHKWEKCANGFSVLLRQGTDGSPACTDDDQDYFDCRGNGTRTEDASNDAMWLHVDWQDNKFVIRISKGRQSVYQATFADIHGAMNDVPHALLVAAYK